MRRARSTSYLPRDRSNPQRAVGNARKRFGRNGNKQQREWPDPLKYRSRRDASFRERLVTGSPARTALSFDYNQKDSAEHGDGSDHVTQRNRFAEQKNSTSGSENGHAELNGGSATG